MLSDLIFCIATYFGLFTGIFYLITFLEHRDELKPKTSKLKHIPSISILIPAYNEADVIAHTLKSLLEVDYPKKEIIVVDDGSTDKTYEIAKQFKGVKVFRKENGGKASALNFGVKRCTGELIMTLDADSFPEKDALKKMVPYFSDPTVMAVNPYLKVWNPQNLLEKIQSLEYPISTFVKKLLEFLYALCMVPGAPLIRAEFLREHKYDEGNLTEDFEMGLQIKANGYQIAQALDAVVYTKVPNTLKKLMKQRVRWDCGLMYNLKKYKFMFGGYGNLGFFLLPAMGISIGLTGFLFVYYLFMTIWNWLHTLHLFSLIGYELRFNLPSIRVMEYLMNEKTYLIGVSFGLGLTIYLLAKGYTKEEFKIEYLVYTLIYVWLLALFRVIAIARYCLGRMPRW